jgi:hypothetical protein
MFRWKLRASLLHTDIDGGMEDKAKEISCLSPLYVRRRYMCQQYYFIPQSKIKKWATRRKRSSANLNYSRKFVATCI